MINSWTLWGKPWNSFFGRHQDRRRTRAFPLQLTNYFHGAEFFFRSPNFASTQELPNFLWNPKFITVFTRALHWSLSYVRWIQSIAPYSIPLRSTLTLSIHLGPGLLGGLFASGFPTNILYAFLFTPFVLHALPIPSSYHSNYVWRLARSKFYEVPHYAVFSSLLSFHLFRSKYSSQHPILKSPQLIFLP
jgi:hypothetical protein